MWARVQSDWWHCKKRDLDTERVGCMGKEKDTRRHSEQPASCKSRTGASEETKSANSWILDFQPLKPRENKFLLLKIPPVVSCYGNSSIKHFFILLGTTAASLWSAVGQLFSEARGAQGGRHGQAGRGAKLGPPLISCMIPGKLPNFCKQIFFFKRTDAYSTGYED